MSGNDERRRQYSETARELVEQSSPPMGLVADVGALSGSGGGSDTELTVAQEAHDLDPGKEHRDTLKQKALDYAIKGGNDDTSKAGLRLNQVNASGTSAGDGKSAKKRAAERAFEEAVLHALQTNTLGAYIADQVFGDMSEAEIDGIVREIEATTGQSFEDYARGILGDDAVQRLPGESDADFRKRILGKITEEIVGPETGEIKPEYADDPLAQVIQGNEAYQTVIRELQDLNAQVAETGKTAETDRVIDEMKTSYVTADVAGKQIEDEGYKEEVSVGQDGQRDGVMDSEFQESENKDMYSMFGSPTPAEVAARESREEFNTVSPPQPGEGPAIEREVAVVATPLRPVV